MYRMLATLFLLAMSWRSVAQEKANEISLGCRMGINHYTQLIPENVVRKTLFDVAGIKYINTMEYCTDLAGGIKKVTARGTDLRDLMIEIVGEPYSTPDKFNDRKGPENEKGNRGAGCMRYYLNGANADVFLGFAASFQITSHAARFALADIKVAAADIGTCADSRTPGSSAVCTLNYCDAIHYGFGKAQANVR